MEKRLLLLGNLRYVFKKVIVIQKQAFIKIWFKL